MLVLFGAFVGGLTCWGEQHLSLPGIEDYHFLIYIFAGCMVSSVVCICFYLRERNRNIGYDLKYNITFIQAISEVYPMGVGVGKNGLCCYANEFLCRMTGYDQDEMLGVELNKLCPKEVLRQVDEIRKKYMPGDVDSIETRLFCKDGSIKYILLKLIFPEAEGWCGKSVFAVIDITERKRMEDELKRSYEELERRKDAYKEAHRLEQQVVIEKNNFQTNMCHEIRTPLNGLNGMLQILRDNLQQEENLEIVKYALDSCQRLSKLLNNVLHVSRLEAGKEVVMNNPFDMGYLLDEVRSLFQPAASQNGLYLKTELGQGLPPIFIGDDRKVVQILNNLVGNAVKFTDEGGVKISVDFIPVTQGRGRVLFTVSDTGIGIPDDNFERIFNSYSQVDGSVTRKYEGAGLGLTIVKELIAVMGGNLSIDSELGKGTSIYFSLEFRALSTGIDY